MTGIVGDWHVATSGSAVVGLRQAFEARDYVVEEYLPAHRRAVVVSESPKQLLPGASVAIDGESRRVTALDIDLDGEHLAIHVEVDAPVAGGLGTLIEQHCQRVVDRLGLVGSYEYRVASVDGSRYGLAPTEAEFGLPSLQRVSYRCGIPGVTLTLPLGARVLVQFVNGDRSRPHIIGFEGDGPPPTALAVDSATTLDLCAGSQRVVREGDVVIVGTEIGPIAFQNPLDPNLSRVRA